jgi:hypothetical protein
MLSDALAKSWEIVGADLSRPLPIYRLWIPCRDLANAPLRSTLHTSTASIKEMKVITEYMRYKVRKCRSYSTTAIRKRLEK